MRKEILPISGLLIIIVLSGCLGPDPNDDLKLYKSIPTAEMSPECIENGNDVCALFDCMVDLCWCDSGNFPSPVLVEGTTTISSEQEAINLVKDYVQTTDSEYSDVRRAVNLGDDVHRVFFNVFAYNDANDEKVFTVAADGTIIKTICGV